MRRDAISVRAADGANAIDFFRTAAQFSDGLCSGLFDLMNLIFFTNVEVGASLFYNSR